MRYHWGLGIGHTYSWKGPQHIHSISLSTAQLSESGTTTVPVGAEHQLQPETSRLNAGRIAEEESMAVESQIQTIEGEGDDPGEEGYELNVDYIDGMDDRENEDLGDEWSESDDV